MTSSSARESIELAYMEASPLDTQTIAREDAVNLQHEEALGASPDTVSMVGGPRKPELSTHNLLLPHPETTTSSLLGETRQSWSFHTHHWDPLAILMSWHSSVPMDWGRSSVHKSRSWFSLAENCFLGLDPANNYSIFYCHARGDHDAGRIGRFNDVCIISLNAQTPNCTTCHYYLSLGLSVCLPLPFYNLN